MGASGAPIKGVGKAELELSLGPLNLGKDLGIEDDAVLGYDILVGGKGRPADTLLSHNKVDLNEGDLPIFQIGKVKHTRRMTVANKANLFGHAVTVDSVYVRQGRVQGDDFSSYTFIIEPSEHFKETSFADGIYTG